MTFNEFHSVWMLLKLKKRKRIENFEIQPLREIVKENAEDVVDRFENKFKEIKIEGKIKPPQCQKKIRLPSKHPRKGEKSDIY